VPRGTPQPTRQLGQVSDVIPWPGSESPEAKYLTHNPCPREDLCKHAKGKQILTEQIQTTDFYSQSLAYVTRHAPLKGINSAPFIKGA